MTPYIKDKWINVVSIVKIFVLKALRIDHVDTQHIDKGEMKSNFGHKGIKP